MRNPIGGGPPVYVCLAPAWFLDLDLGSGGSYAAAVGEHLPQAAESLPQLLEGLDLAHCNASQRSGCHSRKLLHQSRASHDRHQPAAAASNQPHERYYNRVLPYRARSHLADVPWHTQIMCAFCTSQTHGSPHPHPAHRRLQLQWRWMNFPDQIATRNNILQKNRGHPKRPERQNA